MEQDGGAGGGPATRGPLAEAEARRDRGDWRGAAEAYATHLARSAQDWRVWIQHGHCVKEAGDPLGAIASYRRAEAGLPEDADLQVQIGHAFKLAGDAVGARAAYARALEIDPVNEVAWREVSGLLAGATRAPSLGPAPEADGFRLLDDLQVVLDLSDLWSWFGSARLPTGIQRIQLEVARAALSRGAAAAEIRLAVFRPATGSWRELPREAFHRLASLSANGADAGDPAWTDTLARVEAVLARSADLGFPPGSWLVNLGTSWELPGYHLALRGERARSGLRYAALVHDVGPVLVPEHSEPAVAARFARWLAVLGIQADLLLAVSEATRRDLLGLAGRELRGLPVAPVRLLRPDARPAAPPVAAPHARAMEIAAEPFILMVGTIESRKDHLFVLNAWLALLRRHGASVPHLLLVGRAGFQAEPALALLRRAPALAGRVTWLDDVADGTLAQLYRAALFTIYHSQHEGWGLPVTEALAAGQVVVAPAQPALVEAGQGLALHHAPGSEPEFLALVERLLFEPGFRDQAAERVAAGLRLRSWRDVAEELLATLLQLPADEARPLPAPPVGAVHRLAEIEAVRPEPAMAWAELLRAGPGWHAPEGWGCWTRPGRALLRLPLPEGNGGPLRLHLALRGTDGPRNVSLRAGRGTRVTVEVAPGARPVVVLDLPAVAGAIDLAIDAAPPPGEDAEHGIGVVAVMACAPEDVGARLGFLERLSFVWPDLA